MAGLPRRGRARLIAAAAGNDAGGIVTYSSAGAQFVYRDPLPHGADHGGLRGRPGDGGPPRGAHGQGSGGTDPRGVRPPPHRLRHHRLRHRQHRPHGDRIRRHRDRLRALRRLALPLGPDRGRRHLVAGALRLLPLRRADLPPPHRRLHRLSDRRRPGPSELARGGGQHACGPTSSATKSFLLLSVALIGTTITPYIQLYEAGAVVDKGVKPDEYRFQRVDAITGAVLAAFVAMSIIVATGATIGGTGPLTSASTAAEALKPVAGAAAETLFGLGLLGASALAAAVVPLSTSYAVAEAIGVERSVSSSFRQAPVFLGHLHLPDPRGRSSRPRAGQPDHADPQHPGARGRHHAGDTDPHLGPGQPPFAARFGRQRPLGALAWAASASSRSPPWPPSTCS